MSNHHHQIPIFNPASVSAQVLLNLRLKDSEISSAAKWINGFEALANLDSNGDGRFDANDAAVASVRLWQDTNQDGISQASELHSFADLGVASINVSGTASNFSLGGGNTQTFNGSFTKTTGAMGDAGTAQLVWQPTAERHQLFS